jgi:SagB-type dehydrogenase family enzyme
MKYYKRSPFLYFYWNDQNKIVAFNYNRYTGAIVSKEIVKLLGAIPQWTSSSKLFDILSEYDYDKRILGRTLKQLIDLRMIHTKPVNDEDNGARMNAYWNSIDLAMQRQTSFGGYLPGSTKGRPPSPIKTIKGLRVVNLPKIKYSDRRTFYEVLENRKSIRSYGNIHLDLKKMSYFLYSSARIKRIFKDHILGGRLTQRPYPSGGARYPFEIYPVCNSINGIKRGIYHYDPLGHRLIFLNKSNKYQKMFNKEILISQEPMTNREPDVIFIITAIFARTMWKYKKIGLSLIMKDLGCLYQTMYLVATEMNLAPCAFGLSDEALVKEWLNLDWFVESHVGTFTLGLPKK